VVALLDWLALGEAFLFSAISFSAVPSDDTLATRWVSLGDLVIGLPRGLPRATCFRVLRLRFCSNLQSAAAPSDDALATRWVSLGDLAMGGQSHMPTGYAQH
jgi:hypothetical protein